MAGALGLIGRHRAFAIVLGLAAIVHALAWVAFRPALFFGDSYPYMGLGWASSGFVDLRFDRPSGYPILLWAIRPLTGTSAAAVVLVQQLLVLGAGALVYGMLVRLGVGRRLAALAAALILFDSYLLVLADHVLAEIPMLFMVVAGVALILRSRAAARAPWAAAAAGAGGLVLGMGVTVRTATLFILPVAFIYVLWARRDWRVVLAVSLGMAAPVLGYLTWHEQEAQTFSFTRADGWFLYARIAKIGVCGDAAIPKESRVLCPFMPGAPPQVAQNLWGGLLSPARRAYGVGPESESIPVNSALGHFALAIVRDRPLTYARMVGRDTLRYFTPGEQSPDGSDLTVTAKAQPAKQDPSRAGTLHRWASGYDDKPGLPRGIVDGYGNVVHTPRPLLGVLTLLAGALLVVATLLPRRLALPRRREAFLMLGGGLALVLGATATSNFDFRYLLPGLPLLWGGIALVLTDLLELRRARPSPAAAS